MLAAISMPGEKQQQLLYLDQKKNHRTFDLGAFGPEQRFQNIRKERRNRPRLQDGFEEVLKLVFGKDLRLPKGKKFNRFSEIQHTGPFPI